MFHWKILGCAHDDRFWLWLFALSPKDKCWSDLDLLWDHRLQRKHSGDIRGIAALKARTCPRSPNRPRCLYFEPAPLLRNRSIGDARSGVKYFLRIFRLNRQGRGTLLVRHLGLDVDLELALTGLFNLRLKIRTR